mmetsp:Transcript_30438/g.72424  ORF Transcript_30438/g.72424 Transcript_30438/m.72424 type:complete len:223 (-) Transcript_30438:1019-1687(-)
MGSSYASTRKAQSRLVLKEQSRSKPSRSMSDARSNSGMKGMPPPTSSYVVVASRTTSERSPEQAVPRIVSQGKAGKSPPVGSGPRPASGPGATPSSGIMGSRVGAAASRQQGRPEGRSEVSAGSSESLSDCLRDTGRGSLLDVGVHGPSPALPACSAPARPFCEAFRPEGSRLPAPRPAGRGAAFGALSLELCPGEYDPDASASRGKLQLALGPRICLAASS